MLSIERVKELLKDSNMSDEEATEIRDGCRGLAEVIFAQWKYEKLTGKKPIFGPLNKTKKILYDENFNPPENNPIINQ
ncbi:MAG: hypothetical protein ABII89_06660 [Candidatus Omnitrophota bacterium]